ncbi:hypothetical protein [Longimicrobium sp.]|uniref:hypothetical protein n=1 Tax=Longimicrobium sp. TaxID=2029185 RepID=UPI002C157A8A|nr:hypothetical protein [Longimicrobium sp.]HSU12804.1 hypothetical protein [Longimicrobium sp.]
MTRFRTAAGAFLLLAAALPAPVRAQVIEDARVLPRGWVELRGGGIYTQFNSRFGGGGEEPLGALFSTQLQPLAERLLDPILPPLQTGLTSFFTGTAAQVTNPVTPAAITGGAVQARLAGDFRRAPFTLSYGLTRRIMVGVTVPFERNGTAVTSLLLRGGDVGPNTEATTNAAILAKIDPAYAALGGGALLPVTGTPAAVELQRRALALAGDTLKLPTRPINLNDLLASPPLAALLNEEETAALTQASAATGFQLGDVEVGARIQLVNGIRGYPFADSADRRGIRSTLAVSVRLPTAPRADTLFLLVIPRNAGHFGFSADLYNDFFLARKYWVTASAGYTQTFAASVLRRPFTVDRPFPSDTAVFRSVSSHPGSRIRAAVMPRYRLTREWSVAAAYQFEHGGATTYTASDELGDVVLGPVEQTAAWTSHSFGVGASYSTIEANLQGRTPFPVEFSILYRNSFAGSGFAAHSGTIEAGGRILYQLVGRPRRPRADSAATDSARALPAPPTAPPAVTPPGERPAVTAPGEPQPTVRPPAAPPAPPTSAPPAEPTTRPAHPQPQPRPVPPPPPAPPPTSVPPPE